MILHYKAVVRKNNPRRPFKGAPGVAPRAGSDALDGWRLIATQANRSLLLGEGNGARLPRTRPGPRLLAQLLAVAVAVRAVGGPIAVPSSVTRGVLQSLARLALTLHLAAGFLVAGLSLHLVAIPSPQRARGARGAGSILSLSSQGAGRTGGAILDLRP